MIAPSHGPGMIAHFQPNLMELDESSSNSWGLFGSDGVRGEAGAQGFKPSSNFTTPLEVMPDNILDSEDPHIGASADSFPGGADTEEVSRPPEDSSFGGLDKENSLQAEALPGVGFQEGSTVGMWSDHCEPAYIGGGGGGKGPQIAGETLAAGQFASTQVSSLGTRRGVVPTQLLMNST